MKDITLLDCSLRDGGYYNEWDFAIDDAERYINDMAASGIKYIEIGFRFTPRTRFLGPFAYSRDSFLTTLKVPQDITLGVMINAGDYLGNNGPALLGEYFVPANQSPVELVRIAAHLHEVPRCDWIVAHLKSLGYIVGFNIMQVSEASDNEIRSIVADVENNFVPFDVLYFADSLGRMTADDVIRVLHLFQQESPKPLGFHGHDNMGRGVANSLVALAEGASWVDATVTGIGRGAGNTQTEYLTLELTRVGLGKFDSLHIGKAATGWLADMKRKHGWGTNVFYYQAANSALHPTYVQEMISSERYEAIDILVTLNYLKKMEKPSSFDINNIDSAIAAQINNHLGESDVRGIWEGAPVILLANGTNAEKHWPKICAYAKKKKIPILAINQISFVQPSALAGVLTLHPARLSKLLESTTWCNVPLFIPAGSIPNIYREEVNSRSSVYDFGAKIDPGVFSAHSNGCELPRPLAALYGLALAKAGGASEVILAGLDGYDGASQIFQESNASLRLCTAQLGIPVRSLTKTHYDVPILPLYGEV